MVIGITGNSGVGKTTISEKLAKKINARVINADILAKELSKAGTKYYTEIVKRFGKDILRENKEIDRKKLANIIYSEPKKLELINKITTEYVVPEIIEKIKEADTNTIIDVPLLFENSLQNFCDLTVSILANEEEKISRIKTREKIEKDQILKRLSVQPRDEYYIENSDIVIYNNKDQDIEKIVEEVYEETCLKLGKN